MKKINTKKIILSLFLLLGLGSSLNAWNPFRRSGRKRNAEQAELADRDGLRRRVETRTIETQTDEMRVQEEQINHLHDQLRERINDFDPAMERAHIKFNLNLSRKFNETFDSNETLSLFLEYLRLNDLLGQLRVLYLNNNHLTVLPANFGQGMRILKVLFLANNGLRELPANFGRWMGNLEALRLSYNRLRELPANFGQEMISLQMLFLANNNLTELPVDFCQWMGRLGVLWLSNNELTVLPANFDLWMIRLLTFDIGNNPLTQLTLEYLSNFVRDIRNVGRQFDIDIQLPVPQINLEIRFPSQDLVLQQLPVQMTIQDLNAMEIDYLNITADQSCGFCLQSIEELARADDGTEMAIIDGCHHIFCKECLLGWLTGHNTCPVCMQPVTGVKLVTLVG